MVIKAVKIALDQFGWATEISQIIYLFCKLCKCRYPQRISETSWFQSCPRAFVTSVECIVLCFHQSYTRIVGHSQGDADSITLLSLVLYKNHSLLLHLVSLNFHQFLLGFPEYIKMYKTLKYDVWNLTNEKVILASYNKCTLDEYKILVWIS